MIHLDKIEFDWKDSDFNFHWKFGDFEICTVREEYTNNEYRYDNKSPIRQNIPVELVKWENYTDKDGTEHRSCFVVAWWRRTDDYTYELQFVGDRPFEYIEPNEIADIWVQLKAAQNMLDAYVMATRE